jgi:hypothetical protein
MSFVTFEGHLRVQIGDTIAQGFEIVGLQACGIMLKVSFSRHKYGEDENFCRLT